MPNTITTADIILTPVEVYHAPVGSTLPANTVAAGAAWPGAWTFAGSTAAPLKAIYEFDTVERKVQDAIGAIKRHKVDESFRIETVLSELTMAKLALAWDGTSATAGNVEEYKIGGEVKLQERMWGFEGNYTNDAGATYPIRCFLWRATSISGGDLEFSNQDYVGIALKVRSLHDLSKPKGERLFAMRRIVGVVS